MLCSWQLWAIWQSNRSTSWMRWQIEKCQSSSGEKRLTWCFSETYMDSLQAPLNKCVMFTALVFVKTAFYYILRLNFLHKETFKQEERDVATLRLQSALLVKWYQLKGRCHDSRLSTNFRTASAAFVNEAAFAPWE